MADDAKSTVDQTGDESLSDQVKKSNTRPFILYTRAHLLHLSKSPLVTIPNGMPHFKDWFGEWGESSAATAKKEPMSEALGPLSRDRARFRRDTEDAEGTRVQSESLASGRPTFKNALSFSQASGSAMGSMGSFRHPSSRLESDARREEREREGRRETENLRNLSQQFDRERRDRESAPHLPRVVSGASSANGRDPKSRDSAREPRDNAKDPSREARRGRGDDTHDWRRARDDDRQRSRSRPRGKGEPANGSKRERDNWTASEGRRGVTDRRRNAGDDRQEGKTKDDRASKNDREKQLQEEEPAWMGDYVPDVGSHGILGSTKGEDSIQAWKRELKEKERAAQGIEADSLEDDGLGGLDEDVTRMKLVEEQAKQNTFGQQEDDGLDEIQRFKKLMQESERQRREDAERKALELAGKADSKQTTDQNQPISDPADTSTTLSSSGPPGLIKHTTEIDSVPTPPVPETLETNGRVGGVSLGSSNWPISTTTTPLTTAAALSTTTWNQPGGASADPTPNPRLSPVQARRFTQDGAPADGAAVGTRSTSRFANFFGDKHREPSAPQFSSNAPPAPSHPPFMQGGNEPQLLDTLLARLAESQVRPQAQPPQTQDRAFAQRNPSMASQPQYGNTGPQNMANMQHAQPPLIQHQRAQLSMHQQQQQQLLSSLNAGTLSSNTAGIHSLGHNAPSSYTQGVNSGMLNPSLNLDIDGRFVSDNLVPGLRPRNGSVAFDEDFQVNPAAASMGRGVMQQHRPQPSFDALHRQQQQAMYNMGGNRTPSGGFRNGPSPIGGHNPNPMQRAPDLPQYLSGMTNPLGGGPGGAGGNTNGPQQQYGNRLGAMGNLGNMLGAGGQISQPRFDERQRIQQGQAIHHQPGQSLSGIGGLPLDFGLLQQQPPQRQMPRAGMPGVGGYPMQQNQSQMGPRNASGLLGGMGTQQYPGHMHNDFVVQPNQTTNASDIMAMFLAGQGNTGMGGA
ncbi:hypothetical protein V565_079260 [Rhizoctonia solani 123E]|uniref:Uncharacterized protein n=1 Tax=Rhizoctonia solani 123E TaxID=1423351 RepID=A0A074RYT4_9AGAM|nr:hypothetical protein V565_079260 [Rhizoctonia solani 123E]